MSDGAAPPLLDPQRHALFVDFDGTLVDFAPEPDAVVPRPGTAATLQRLADRLGGAVALVSGRRVADLDRFLAPLVLPACGVHGQEFRVGDGGLQLRAPSSEIAAARRRLAAMMAPDDVLLLEDKGAALVLHYRKTPDQRDRAEALAQEAVAGLDSLTVVNGHAIAEIRQRGVTKADAIRLFLGFSPFLSRLPVFIGDDTTDEDGFAAAADAGGFGVKVGPGDTVAAYRLRDVAAVHQWLTSMA